MVGQLTSTPWNTRAGKTPLDVIKLFKVIRLMWDLSQRTTLIYWVAQGIEKSYQDSCNKQGSDVGSKESRGFGSDNYAWCDHHESIRVSQVFCKFTNILFSLLTQLGAFLSKNDILMGG